MYDDVAFAELIDRVGKLEEIVDELAARLAQATTASEINVAGGIAHQALHGGE